MNPRVSYSVTSYEYVNIKILEQEQRKIMNPYSHQQLWISKINLKFIIKIML